MVIMATASGDSKRSNVYHCPVCLEAIKTPRSLPCLHTFCEDCLHAYITTAAEKDAMSITCPVCRKPIPPPEFGITHDKWARRFPINYYLNTEFVGQQSSLEECKFCLRANKTIRAEHYCKNCAESICDSCKSLHVYIPSLKDHSIITIEEFRNKPTLPDIDEMCQSHPGKSLEVFCLDHRKMCCSICFATQHRHCSDVQSLEDCANGLVENSVEVVVEALESLSCRLENEISEKEKLGERMTKSKESYVSQIIQQVKAAQKNLEILLENFKSEANDEHSKNYDKLGQVLKVLQSMKTSVVCDQQMLKTVLKYGSKRQIFVSLEKVQMQLNDQTKLVTDVASTQLSSQYTLKAKPMEDILLLTSIGNMQCVPDGNPALSEELISELARPQDVQADLNIDPQSLTWTKQWSFELSGRPYSITFLGRNIVAVMSAERTLAVLSEKGSELYSHKVPCSVDLADTNAIDDKTVYISFRKQKYLKKYNVNCDNITETGGINLQSVAEGFCFIDGNIVHASKESVNISSMSGDLLKSFKSSVQGNIAFLAGSPRRGFFCHTSGKNICFRKADGEEIKTIPLTCTKPRGIGIDFQGNAYICCHEQSKIMQVSHKDSKIMEYSGFQKDIYTIAFDQSGKSFVTVCFHGKLQYHVLSRYCNACGKICS